jgi:hypothetical protein
MQKKNRGYTKTEITCRELLPYRKRYTVKILKGRVAKNESASKGGGVGPLAG